MNYQLTLNNGQVLTLTGVSDFNSDEFALKLNDRNITFVSIGGALFNKNLIGSIVPVANETTA